MNPATPSSASRRFPAIATLALLAAIPLAAWAGPEEPLVAPLADDLRAPPLRCEWIAGEFEAIERQLSLYRQELASIYVAVDGRTIGDSAGGTILALEFETWKTGPASMTVALDASRLSAKTPLTQGRRIEAWFTDRGGRPHPLFCGELAVVRAHATTPRIDLLGVTPRSGGDGRSDAGYVAVTGADVLQRLAAAAGLTLEIQDRRQRTVFPVLERRQLADWPFMRQVARLSGYEIVLLPGGSLLATETTFAPPAMPSRRWQDVTLADIAGQIARELGRRADVRLTAAYPAIAITQTRPDEDFLVATASAYQVSAWFEAGKLMLAEDGVWTEPPPTPASILTGHPLAPEELHSRITVLGSADGVRSFHRSRPQPLLRQKDPERIPVLQSTLLLGHAMRAADPPRFEFADATATAAALERAITRLERSAGLTAERRFLVGYARSHRPTLLHVYRRMPDGFKALDAIGR